MTKSYAEGLKDAITSQHFEAFNKVNELMVERDELMVERDELLEAFKKLNKRQRRPRK